MYIIASDTDIYEIIIMHFKACDSIPWSAENIIQTSWALLHTSQGWPMSYSGKE